MRKFFTLPNDLRQDLEAHLGGEPLPSEMSIAELRKLIEKVKDPALKQRIYELFGAQVGGKEVHQASAAKQAEELKTKIVSKPDEHGRPRPNRSFYALAFMAVAMVAVFALVVPQMYRALTYQPPRPKESNAIADAPQRPSSPTEDEMAVSLPKEVRPVRADTGNEPSAGPVCVGDCPEGDTGVTVSMPTVEEGAFALEGEGGGLGGAQLAGGGGGSASSFGGGGGQAIRLSGGGARVRPTSYRGGSGTVGRVAGGGVSRSVASGGGGVRVATAIGGAYAHPAQSPQANTSNRVASARSAPLRVEAPKVGLASRPPLRRQSLSDLRPGALVKGKVVAAPVLAAGLSQVPVSVEDVKGRVWLGIARLAGASGRVMIQFDELVVDNHVHKVKAVALDTSKTYGVPVEVKDVAPSLASSMIRASISGIAAYVQGLEAQKKVYTHDGVVVEEPAKAPPLELQVARRVAELFQLPVDDQTVSRIYVLKSGTPVYVLVRSLSGSNATAR